MGVSETIKKGKGKLDFFGFFLWIGERASERLERLKGWVGEAKRMGKGS